MDSDPMDEQRDHEQGGPLPPPVPPPPGTTTSWWLTPVARDPDAGHAGGVVAGLCRSYGFDLKTTRIALVIASLVLPAILLLYVAAWVLLPPRPEQAVPLRDVVVDRRRLPLMIAIGIALAVGSLGSFGSWFLFGGLPWGVGLIALGVLLWAAPNIAWRSRTDVPTQPLPPMGSAAGRRSTAPTTVRTARHPPTARADPAGAPAGPGGADRDRRRVDDGRDREHRRCPRLVGRNGARRHDRVPRHPAGRDRGRRHRQSQLDRRAVLPAARRADGVPADHAAEPRRWHRRAHARTDDDRAGAATAVARRRRAHPRPHGRSRHGRVDRRAGRGRHRPAARDRARRRGDRADHRARRAAT